LAQESAYLELYQCSVGDPLFEIPRLSVEKRLSVRYFDFTAAHKSLLSYQLRDH